LAAADSFAQRANSMGDALADSKNDLLKQAQATVDEINERAKSIGELNRRIQQAVAQGEDAADLKDQRNHILLDLSQMVDVRTIDGDNGSILVQAAGTTLVEGVDSRALGIDLNSDGSIKLTSQRDGGAPMDVTQFLSGGTLAGI